MKYFVNFLILLSGTSIILMPVWIIGIGRISWPKNIRRAIIITMVAVSVLYSMPAILKPTENGITGILADIPLIGYLLIVFISAYRYWPR